MKKESLKNFHNKSPEISINKSKSDTFKEDFSYDLKVIKWLNICSRILLLSSLFIVIKAIFELLSENNFGNGESFKYYTFIFSILVFLAIILKFNARRRLKKIELYALDESIHLNAIDDSIDKTFK